MDDAVAGTLRQQHPQETPLPLETFVSYVQQIADALQYAHEQNVIHRDVKPENRLLDQHHQVLLSNLGIAAATQSTHEQKAQGLAGTVTYMSPEQLKGQFGPASDQYSLGVVVYEWLWGQRPFRGSFAELCTQHLLTPPPPLHEKMPSISPELELVVMKALAKDPAQRFLNISAFATALRETCLTQSQSIRQFRQGSIAENEAQENPAIRGPKGDISSPVVEDTSLVALETVVPSTDQRRKCPRCVRGMNAQCIP